MKSYHEKNASKSDEVRKDLKYSYRNFENYIMGLIPNSNQITNVFHELKSVDKSYYILF
jgi:hypothetical protein